MLTKLHRPRIVELACGVGLGLGVGCSAPSDNGPVNSAGSAGSGSDEGGSMSTQGAGGSLQSEAGPSSISEAAIPNADASLDPGDAARAEAGLPADGGGLPVLIYTNATAPFHIHDSIPTGGAAIQRSLTAVGIASEISASPDKFTTAGLSAYGVVVLVETAGYPFGMPGTTQIDALVSFVVGGRGLVGIHNSTHAYPESTKFGALQGAQFVGHDGVEMATCTHQGTHPSVARLPASWKVNDEIYRFSDFRPDNQVVLRCGTDMRPVSWYRTEGVGRIFYTGLGHDAEWSDAVFVDDHLRAGIRWALGGG